MCEVPYHTFSHSLNVRQQVLVLVQFHVVSVLVASRDVSEAVLASELALAVVAHDLQQQSLLRASDVTRGAFEASQRPESNQDHHAIEQVLRVE